MKKGNVIFVRHGESRANVEERFYADDRQNFLSLNGAEQVVTMSEIMYKTKLHIDTIVTSDMTRARQTTSIIHQHLRNNPDVIIDDRFNEWNHGTMASGIYDPLFPCMEEDEHRSIVIPAYDLIEQMVDNGQTVMLVSHYFTMVHLFEMLMDITEADLYHIIDGYIPNSYPLIWNDDTKLIEKLSEKDYIFPEEAKHWRTAK